MFRRSRFSIRPNVGTAGRTATSQETPAASQEPSETPIETSENSSAIDVTLSEKGEGNEQNGEGTNSSSALQRRKRFSIKPKVAPGRTPALSRMPKSPVKAVSTAPVDVSSTDISKPLTSSQAGTSAGPHGFQSPRRRRHSEDKMQPKLTPMSSDHLDPLPVERAENSSEQTLSSDQTKKTENISCSQVKDLPARLPDKVPPSLPDKEASEISEKAKTLVSSKNMLSLSPSALSLSRLLNSPSDLQRLVKAQKLRQLLKQERCKEKRLKKTKIRAKEFTLDPSKMTMRDLIHYLPTSNPMMSCLEDSAQENETVVPLSPGREESPERAQEPEVIPTKVCSGEEDVHEEEVEAAEEEVDEEALMVPQVKVAEDGTLIIDEESLTVEVQRAKGPNPAQDREPIFERGSTTTYSSFRKGTYAKPWSIEETDMFFLAVSMVGTDFSMICQLFPHRARSEIKNKFKKEERQNSWRIDKAFRERRKLDLEYFSKLLEKVLEVQKDRRKLKSLSKENATKTSKTKSRKGRKTERKQSDEEEEDENHVSDLEEEAQKENEDQCNERGSPAADPEKKSKRKIKAEALTEDPSGKKNKIDEKSNEQSEAGIPQDSEATLEDLANSDMIEETSNVNTVKDTAVKPAKLSRGRAPKPLLPLGLKRGKKPVPPTESKEVSEKGEECEREGASKEKANKDELSLSQDSQGKSHCDAISSEEEDATVKPQRPTRYGRVPKPVQPLNYPSKEDRPSSASETAPASPSASKSKPKRTAKRGKSSKPQSAQKSKKPKLVTLRSSKSDFSDDEDENQWEDEDGQVHLPLACSSKHSDASVFVPTSLHVSNPEISEVDDSMVDLDILASMPDVLGISQDAMCPDSSCRQAQHETGNAEPCEHQLDLLVDVIDFLSTEQTEVCQDESYNEAAQTLLTIGNVAHVSQSANDAQVQECTTGTTAADVKELSNLEEEDLSPELNITSVSAEFGQEATEKTATVASLDLQSNITDSGEKCDISASELKTTCDLEPAPQLQSNRDTSNKNPPLTTTGRLSKLKPKPNLSRTTRTSQPGVQTEMSKERKAEETHAVAPSLSQVSKSLPATQETTPKTSDSAQASVQYDISFTELIEEFSDMKDTLDQVESDATSDQNSSVIQRSCFSEPSKDPPSTRDAESASEVATAPSGLNELSPSDSTMAEVVQESFVGSFPANESSENNPTPPAENVPVCQKEGSKTGTTYQSKRIRLPKVKPKPNLPQTSIATRSKPQTTKTLEKDLHPTPNPEFYKESQLTCIPSSTQSTENLPASTEIKTCVVSGDQTALDVAKPDLTVTEIQNLSQVQLEPVGETSKDAGSASSSIKSALAQEGGSNLAEEIISEEVCKTLSTPQSKRSRLQRIKPKPNLLQTLRAARSKQKTITEPAEELSCPGTQQARILPSEKLRESTAPAAVSQLLTSQAAFKTTDEEKKMDTGLIDQTEIEANASDPCATESQKLSKVHLEPSRQLEEEETTRNKGSVSQFLNENLKSSTETTESICNKTATFDSENETSQVDQMSHGDSALVQERNDSPELLPVGKHNVEAASACQLRRSRLQKLKPKPNLPQTSRTGRSKPQATEAPVEKEATTTTYVEAQQPCTSSPKKRSERSESASVLKPSHTAEYVAGHAGQIDIETPTSDKSVTENLNFPEVQLEPTGKQTTINKYSSSEIIDECPSSHDKITKSSSDQRVTESQAGPESNIESTAVKEGSSDPAQIITPVEHFHVTQDNSTAASTCLLRSRRLQKPKPNLPRTTRAARSKLQSAEEPAERGSSPVPKSDSDKTSGAIKPQTSCSTFPAKQSQNTDAGLAEKVDFGVPTSDHGASMKSNVSEAQLEPVLDLATRETKNTCEFTEGNVTPCVRVTESSLTNVASSFAQPVIEASKDPVSHMPLVVRQSPTMRPESTEDTVTELEAQPTCSIPLETPTTDCASDPVPSLKIASTPSCTDEFSSAQEKMKTNVGLGQVLTSDCTEQNVPQRRQRFPKLKPKPNLGSPSRITLRKSKADDCCKPLKGQPMDTSSVTLADSGGDRGGTEITREKKSALDKVSNDRAADTSHVSHEDVKMDMSTNVASSNNQPIINVTAASDVQVDSSESRVNPLFTSADSPTCSQGDSSAQSVNHTELTDSFKTSNESPQTRRGRLVKPKPTLHCSSHPQQLLKVHNTKSAKADTENCTQVVGALVDEKHESDHQKSAKGFTDKLTIIDSSSNDARVQVSEGCETQLTSSQNALTSSIEGIQSYPLLSQILPEQVPSDPDEPFFILSLTEIPVSSAGDMLNSTAEHLPYLSVTDVSKQQPIDSGQSSTAGDGSTSDVSVLVSTKESDAISAFNVEDISQGSAVYTSEAESNNFSLQKDPVDLQGNPTVQPQLVDSKETDLPPSKQRLTGRKGGRKAKLPVKSNTRKKKQMTPAVTETESPTSQTSTTQDSGHLESSAQTASGDKETLACGKESDSSLGLQTAQRVGRFRRSRKAEEFPPYASETKASPSRKAASHRAKAKTASAAGKPPSHTVASVSHDVTLTQSKTKTASESHSPAQSLSIKRISDRRSICSHPTPSSSDNTEASASHKGDCAEHTSVEEEPIVVSQCFLSDIFTEVAEG